MNYKNVWVMQNGEKLRTVPALKRLSGMSRQLERQNNFPAVRWLTMLHCDSRYLANIEKRRHAAQPAGGDSAIKNMGLPVERYFNPELSGKKVNVMVSHKLRFARKNTYPS